MIIFLGGTRTAPVDLPYPRRPPEGYVEMSFKVRPSLQQDYINMNMGVSARNNRQNRKNNRKENIFSQPTSLQTRSNSMKTPNFLPLNGSSNSESQESTPASPPQATPTGSTATIFPFYLNSPQSPEKPFSEAQDENSKSLSTGDVSSASSDYAVMEPLRKISAPSPLAGAGGNSLPKLVEGNTLSKIVDRNSTVAVDKPPSPKGSYRSVSNSQTSQEVVLAPLAKRLNDLTVSKPRLVTTSPSISPTPPGFKSVQSKPSSPKLLDETATPTPTPSPLDSEGYETLQIGSATLHYASLDLPEVSGAPPVSPTPAQEVFKYAEIDFAKLKQN